MTYYQLLTTALFNEDFPKTIPKQYQEDFMRRIRKLRNNPFVGKPLGDRYFRELKLNKFRVYFLIFEKEIIVFVVAVSDKKSQSKTIALIKEKYPDLRNLVKNINSDK